MREILFRGKRLDTGEWVEGNVVLSPDADEEWKAIIIPTRNNYMFSSGNDDEDIGFENWHKVDPETVCQFTGLYDKNNNRIYEKDIVKCCSIDVSGRIEEFVSDVFWFDCMWMLHEEECCDGMLCYYDMTCEWGSHVPEIEIIGNIFDNPELMESGGSDE